MTIAAALVALAATTAPGLIQDHATVDLVGTVGSSPVRMNLFRNGKRIEGYYVYEKRYVIIDLAGSIESDGRIRLTESGRSGQSKEVFSGREKKDGWSGTWSPRGQGKSRKFSLRVNSNPYQAPASWRRFERASCPVSFLIPPRWRPHEEEGRVVLDAVTDGFDDGLEIRWGKSPELPTPYEPRPDRWFLTGENGAFPATDSLKIGGLAVSRDDRPCRIQSSRGYQGLGDCASALVRGEDFWVVFNTQGPRYGPALDLILSSLKEAPR